MARLTESQRRMRLASFLLGTALWIASPWSQAQDLRETPAVRAYRKAAEAVVSISSEKTLPGRTWSQSMVEPQRVNGMGTGVVIDPRGYILTNAHVVERVEKLRVKLHDGRDYEARVLQVHPTYDMAIIKVDAPIGLKPLELGSSANLMIGEPVVAIGNAYGYSHTVTTGIISQLHRTVRLNETLTYYDLIQTDASINPGNSGGPLLNIYGEAIGINVAIRAEAQNIGFALPIDQVKEVAARMIASLRVPGVSPGVTYVDLSTRPSGEGPREGVAIRTASANSPLQPGDVVTQVANIPVRHAIDFERAWLGLKPGDSVTLTVLRGDQTVTVEYRIPGGPSDLVWDRLGLRLAQLEAREVQKFRSELRGGMQVTTVREGSPAAQAGIQAGDALVGLHRWETLNYDNILYILRQTEVQSATRLRALVLRDRRIIELWMPWGSTVAAR